MQVRELLHKRIREMYLNAQFGTDVLKPLNIEALIDQQVRTPTSCYGAYMFWTSSHCFYL